MQHEREVKPAVERSPLLLDPTMVRTADPQSRIRSLVLDLKRSHAPRRMLGSSAVASISSGNSSRTSSNGSSLAAAPSVSRASGQSTNGRSARSRSPSPSSGAAALERTASSSGAGRPLPLWNTVLRASAKCCRRAVFPTRRRPQTIPRALPRRSHHASRAASSVCLLTNFMLRAYRQQTSATLHVGDVWRWLTSMGASRVSCDSRDALRACRTPVAHAKVEASGSPTRPW